MDDPDRTGRTIVHGVMIYYAAAIFGCSVLMWGALA
jgi:hypothetical protein